MRLSESPIDHQELLDENQSTDSKESLDCRAADTKGYFPQEFPLDNPALSPNYSSQK